MTCKELIQGTLRHCLLHVLYAECVCRQFYTINCIVLHMASLTDECNLEPEEDPLLGILHLVYPNLVYSSCCTPIGWLLFFWVYPSWCTKYYRSLLASLSPYSDYSD